MRPKEERLEDKGSLTGGRGTVGLGASFLVGDVDRGGGAECGKRGKRPDEAVVSGV